MWRVLVLLGLAALPGLPRARCAWGDEPLPSEALSVEAAAEAAIAAADGADTEALAVLVRRLPPDPWVVADELLARGRREVAQALVRAAPGPDAARMLAWLETAQPEPDHRALRDALRGALQARLPDPVERAAQTLAGFPLPADDVLAIDLLRVRAQLAGRLGRGAEELALERQAAERAERLGATRPAAEAWQRASLLAQAGGDLRSALTFARGRLRAAELCGRPDVVVLARLRVGELLLEGGSAEEAGAILEQALALTQAEPPLPERPLALALRAKAHLLARELEAAERRAREGLGAPGTPPAPEAAYHLCWVLASLARLHEDLPAARAHWRTSAQIAREGGDRRFEAAALQEEAALALAMEDLAGATAAVERAREVLGGAADAELREQLESRWAQALRGARRHEEAATLLLTLARAQEEAGRLAAARESLEAACSALISAGRGEQGVAAVEAARARWPRTAAGLRVRLMLLSSGTRRLSYDFAAAARAVREAVEEARALGDPLLLADALLEQASVGAFSGARLTELQDLLMERVALLDGLGRGAEAAETLLILGEFQGYRGDSGAGLATLEAAAARYGALKHRDGLAQVYATMGHLHFMLGDLDRAEALAKRAIVTGMGTAAVASLSIAGGDLAGVYVLRGTPEKAVQLLEMGVRLAERNGATDILRDALSFLAFAYLFTGQPQQALEAQQRSDALHDPLYGEQPSQQAITHAVALLRLGRYEESLAQSARALAIAEREGHVWGVVGAHTARMAVHLHRGQDEQALAAAEAGLESLPAMVGGLDQEASSFARSVFAEVYVLGVAAARRLGRTADAVRFAESGRAGVLLEAFGGQQALDQLLLSPDQIQAQAQLRERLARAEAALRRAPFEDKRARRVERDALLQELSDSIARLQREAKSAVRLTAPGAASLERIQQGLIPGEALVLYVLGAPVSAQVLGLTEEPGAAVVIERSRARVVALPTRATVEAAAEALDVTQTAVDPTEALAALRRLVVEPLGLGADVTRVLVSPHGPLHGLPFGLLLEGREVGYVPSGTLLLALRQARREAGTGVLAVGRPDYAAKPEIVARVGAPTRAGLGDLPFTEAEAKAVGDVVFVRGEATEERVRRALTSRPRWRAVHFACHGLLDAARPSLSALALTASEQDDGFLTAVEVLTWPWPTDLAVLSGCRTGRGRVFAGEGSVGLTHSFLAAGAPRVLASTWVVDDEATTALMERFYALWNPKDGSPGLDPAAALRGAQDYVRAQERWRHPFYWGAWALWGLPER